MCVLDVSFIWNILDAIFLSGWEFTCNKTQHTRGTDPRHADSSHLRGETAIDLCKPDVS
jgi:hypothetical protein